MARAPRGKSQTGKRAARTGRRPPSALAVVVFLLLAGAAGLAAWLTYSYEPPDKLAGVSEPVLAIDLSKPGSGGQMPRKTAAAQPDETEPDTKPRSKAVAETTPEITAKTPASEQTAPKVAAASPERTEHGATGATDAESRQAPTAPAPSPEPAPPATPDDRATAKQPTLSGESRSGPEAAEALGSFTARGGLRPAPDPALIKSTENGPLPVVAPDGRTPLQVYARPYKATGRPRIAVVVGSLGLSQATTLAAIQQLPGGVTLAFAPYGRNLQDYVNQARAAGHEVLLQVPMEPLDYPTNDPGPHTLLTSLTINRNLKRLDWLLGRFAGYVGVVNYMGGRFTAAESHVRPILEAMRGRGLMFLDARASSASVATRIAGQIGLAVAANDRVIDAIASRAAIDARLLELERLASASGGAVGIGFPYPVTIERLAQWTRAMGDRGYDLAPVSALAVQQGAKP